MLCVTSLAAVTVRVVNESDGFCWNILRRVTIIRLRLKSWGGRGGYPRGLICNPWVGRIRFFAWWCGPGTNLISTSTCGVRERRHTACRSYISRRSKILSTLSVRSIAARCFSAEQLSGKLLGRVPESSTAITSSEGPHPSNPRGNAEYIVQAQLICTLDTCCRV